jgi:glycosyltransferase involved in cell wall biosynthesis
LNAAAASVGERLSFSVMHDQALFDALNTPHKSFAPACDHAAYLRLLGRSEIALLPMEDTAVNRARSDLRFIEAAARRVAPLASTVCYGSTIDYGRTGVLFRNEQELLRQLLWLAINPRAVAIADAARHWVAEHRMLASQTKPRLDWYRSLLARRTELTAALHRRAPELGGAPRAFVAAPRRKKSFNILYYSPFPSSPSSHGNRATINQFARHFQELGHKVHFVLLQSSEYSAADLKDMRATWDTLDIASQSWRIMPASGPVPFDGWYEEGLGERIRRLCGQYDIDIVFCSYVFQSKLLEYVPSHILKVIDTHDKMGNRHDILSKNGLKPEFFSCTPGDEGAYLRRADVVVARREEEARYFDSVTGLRTAMVISHFESPRFLDRTFQQLREIGIVASANEVNLAMLRECLEAIDRRLADMECPFTVNVAGQVADMVGRLPDSEAAVFRKRWVSLHGFVQDLHTFYAGMDLILSPVTVGTGINVKTVQAMAYGMPLLTTSCGSKGIETGDPLHMHADQDSLAQSLFMLAQAPHDLPRLAALSRERYTRFYETNLAAVAALFAHPKLTQAQSAEFAAATADSAAPCEPARHGQAPPAARAFRPATEPLAIVATMAQDSGEASQTRLAAPLCALAAEPGISVQFISDNNFPDLPPGKAAICLLHRAVAEAAGIGLIRQLLAQGYLLVLSCEAAPDNSPDMQTEDPVALRCVHAVQTNTETLADLLWLKNPEIAIFPDAIAELPSIVNFTNNQRRTLFLGGCDQTQDWESLLPALNAAAASLGDRLSFSVMHDRALFDALATPHKSFAPAHDHATYLRLLGQSEIALLPMPDKAVNRARSDLSFIEAAACRVAPLASSVGYGATIEHGRTGVLFRTEQELLHQLIWLAVNPRAVAIADAARHWVAEHRMLASQTKPRLDWYRSLLARRTELTAALYLRAPELSNGRAGILAEPITQRSELRRMPFARIRSPSPAEPHLLFVDEVTRTPDMDSGAAHALNYLKAFHELGFQVTFFGWARPADHGRTAGAPDEIGSRFPAPDVKNLAEWLKTHGRNVSAIVIAGTSVAKECLTHIKAYAPQAKLLFNAIDLHLPDEQRNQQAAASQTATPNAPALQHDALEVVASSDAIIVGCSAEAKILANLAPKPRVFQIPVFGDIPGRAAPFADRHGIVFIGGSAHPANADAILAFLSGIWPLIRAKLPGVQVHIAGPDLPPALANLANADVVAHGHITDFVDLFRTCRVSIAPFDFGAGQKARIVTSLSHGVPVIATSVAVEFMRLRDLSAAGLGDTPARLAQAVTEVYLDAALWQNISDAGLADVTAHFGHDAGKQAIRDMMAAVLVADDSMVAAFQQALKTICDTANKTGALPALTQYSKPIVLQLADAARELAKPRSGNAFDLLLKMMEYYDDWFLKAAAAHVALQDGRHGVARPLAEMAKRQMESDVFLQDLLTDIDWSGGGAGNIAYWLKNHPIQNFGDFLSEYFMARLFLGPVPRRNVVHLVGSCIFDGRVMETARLRTESAADRTSPQVGKVVFWGCGARDADALTPKYRPHAEILAVRGPLTRAALGLPDSTPAADPALLLPALYQPRPAAALGQTICVPHFLDRRSDQELLHLSNCNAVVRTNIAATMEAIEAVIDAIAGAKFVLSASLHGAIVAAAYGIPFAFWVNGEIDAPFKWRDFAASLKIPCEFVPELEQGQRVYNTLIAPALSLPPLWPLLAVAPLAVRPGLVIRVIAADLRRHGMGVLEHQVATETAEAVLAGDSEPQENPPSLSDTPDQPKSVSFYSRDADSRRRLTQQVIAEKSTLLDRWITLPAETGNEAWDKRARLAADLVAGEPAVVDLGCGMMCLEKHLAPGVRYLPVDVVARDDRTVLADLNREPLPKLPADCIVVCGLLEYIHDVPKLLTAMAKHYKTIVISYNSTDTVPAIAERQSHAWVNNFTVTTLEAAFADAGLKIQDKRDLGQQVLWKLGSHHMVDRRASPDRAAIDENALKDRFCEQPFKFMEFSGNATWVCCPSWLPVPIGPAPVPPQDIWNGPVAQDIRRSILDGSFRHCSRIRCHFIANMTLPRRKDVALDQYSPVMPPPTNLNLCYDNSCNISCPSCRKEVYVARKTQQGVLRAFYDTAVAPLLPTAKIVGITGSGDPFASHHFRRVIAEITRSDGPNIDFQTNGVLFDERAWTDLSLEGRVRNIMVSLDAATKPTYDRVRRGGDFDRALRNVRTLVEKRQARKIDFINLDFVVQGSNVSEILNFIDLGIQLGVDSVRFNMIFNWGTFSQAEFQEHFVGSPLHPKYPELLAVLDDPLFGHPMVDPGNLWLFADNARGNARRQNRNVPHSCVASRTFA